MYPGSSFLEKLLGSKQRFYKGLGAKAMLAGEQCWSIQILSDDTDISSVTEWKDGKSAGAKTDYTWMSQPTTFKRGDFIVFDFPVVSITLVNATDSIFAYCEPRLGSH